MEFKKKSSQEVDKGRNVRLSWNGYSCIRRFCVERDFKIGAFVEVAAMEKVENEIKKERKNSGTK